MRRVGVHQFRDVLLVMSMSIGFAGRQHLVQRRSVVFETQRMSPARIDSGR